jgi:type IV secretion system protein VirB4
MRLGEFLKNKFDLALSLPTPKGHQEDSKEMALSDMIPYTVHYDDQTVITKDDGLVQVIKLDGLYFESLSAQQIKQFERKRNTVLRSIANSDRAVYVHLIRKKVDEYPAGQGGTWFSEQFNAAWKAQCKDQSFYKNEIYISVVRNRFRQGPAGLIDRAFSLFSGQKLSAQDLENFEAQAKDLNEATTLLCQSLSEYGARRLQIKRLPTLTTETLTASFTKQTINDFGSNWLEFQKVFGQCAHYKSCDLIDFLGCEHTELGQFFNYLINLESERVAVTDVTLDKALANSWIDCNTLSNMLTVQNIHQHKACAVLSMAQWPSRTSSHMLDEFLRQPVEFVITQSFFFTDRISAEHDMRQERRRIAVNDTEGASELDKDDITQGLQELKRGNAVNGLHHLSVLVHVDVVTDYNEPIHGKQETVTRLDKAVSLLATCFTALDVKPVRERFAAETFFWAQLPAQSQHFMGRRGKIKSSNFAGFASLHNYSTGKIDGNLWGPAIMPFPTESHTAYNFNFHRELEGMVAGHTAFSADTGAGKTTLLAALIAMADKVKPKVFWFDNREGAKVFMAAMGGQHTTLSVHTHTGWNPFQLPDTSENRAYLVELLGLMRTCYGGKLTPDDIERFNKAVHENYELKDPADRRLRNIAWCFGHGELAKDMRIWYVSKDHTGANWQVFDNEYDTIDLDKLRHYCFEMRELIKDGNARPELAVILSYPFHRIEQSMDGSPFIIVLEEGQNLVKHHYWREKIDSYIMQIRRKNGILIFVTPDPKYIYCETDSIQKQTATKIYLPNSEARKSDYVDQLGLTQAEFEFIRDTPTGQRKFLIRRGNESIKAIFDLSRMAQFIPVLSSNDKTIALMNQVIAEVKSDKPEDWVPVFMEKAIEKNTHNLQRISK